MQQENSNSSVSARKSRSNHFALAGIARVSFTKRTLRVKRNTWRNVTEVGDFPGPLQRMWSACFFLSIEIALRVETQILLLCPSTAPLSPQHPTVLLFVSHLVHSAAVSPSSSGPGKWLGFKSLCEHREAKRSNLIVGFPRG